MCKLISTQITNLMHQEIQAEILEGIKWKKKQNVNMKQFFQGVIL